MKILIVLLSFSALGCEGGGKFLTIGDKAPDFSLPDLDGNQFFFKNGSAIEGGREVILSFWATWCPECKKEMPLLNEFANNNKVEIIGINLKESKEEIKTFIESRGIGFKILLDTKGKVARLYNVFSIPTNVLINEEGLIKNMNLDIRQMESYLD